MKILFALFGAMGDIFNGLPVVKALREKYPAAEITWLTLPRYREIADCEWVDRILTHGTGRHGSGIPAQLLEREKFDLVFYPQGSVNHDEWEESGLHMIDFIAKKCGVRVSSRSPEVPIDRATKSGVADFWKEHKLKRKTTLGVACGALSCNPWPFEKFRKLSDALNSDKRLVILHIGDRSDQLLRGAIDCRNIPIKKGIALIRRCDLFIGCDSGPSWMASCTDTPMIVFMDTVKQQRFNVGFAHVMPEKDITELPIESSVETVLRCVRSRLRFRLLGRLVPKRIKITNRGPAAP